MGLLEKCLISLEAEANKLEGRAVLSVAADAAQTAPQSKDAQDVAADAPRQPLPAETAATADIDISDASTVDHANLLKQKEFEKLRHNKNGKVLVSDFIDRRKAGRSTDRRQNKRQIEGLNTLTSVDLRKNFGAKEIVRGVGFSMKGGDVAGLLGPNGAGKTTIFYMIVGFYKPTTGDIKLNNVSIIHGPMYRRARMGIAYLPQEASIFRKLTVEQNIWAILESRKDINKKQKKEKLDELVTEFGIERIRKQYGYTLSGGERRRTEIARALAIDPKFLLLDEPFAGIDPMAVSEIKQIIKRLAENGIGILITDHNVRDTLEITSAAFIINRGSIVARGNREHILENKIVRDVYLGSDFKM
jgi:lipopolysaccharide export system ATP-binding protein